MKFLFIIKILFIFLLIAAAKTDSFAQQLQTLSVTPDSPRWILEGKAETAEYLGRKSLYLDGGAATVKDFELRDGVIDISEWVYLRQHKSGLPDAMQYTPVLNTGLNWQIYSGQGFTGAVEIPKNEWFHLRLEISGAQAKFFVKDMEKPALVINDLKSGIEKGRVALAVLTGATYFSNFEVRETPAAEWKRNPPPMPSGTLTDWKISPAFDAMARNLEISLSDAENKSIKWRDVVAESPGFVVLYRYLDAPHPRVTFQRDFSTRLEPQPGTKVVYAHTNIVSDRDQTKKLYIGYSDEVSVFLNGKILYRGRSAQSFRDPGFLGIMDAENDAVYLPLKKGNNELTLAVSELGGGWGYVCRLADFGNMAVK